MMGLEKTVFVNSEKIDTNESLKQAYYESFDKYTLEDGHLTLDKPLPDEMRSVFEEKGAMKLYDNFYFDEETPDGQVVRVYSQEDEINTPCSAGSFPPTTGRSR